MAPLILASFGGGLPVVAILCALLGLILVAKAYDPAGDVLTKVHSSIDLVKTPADGLEHLIYSFKPDNEYPAGGYTSVGLAAHATGSLTALKILAVTMVQSEGSGGYVPMWNPATGKLEVYEAGADAAALDEVTAGTDLSGELFHLHIYGTRDYTIAL